MWCGKWEGVWREEGGWGVGEFLGNKVGGSGRCFEEKKNGREFGEREVVGLCG